MPTPTPYSPDAYREANERVCSILQDHHYHPDRWHRARAQLLADLAEINDKPTRLTDAKRLAAYTSMLARFDRALGAKD